MLSSGLRIIAGLVAPGMLDLRSSTKKKDPKLKFPQMDVGKPIPKVYAKGSTSRKVDSVD
jgi:hypothetical protein